MFTLTLTGRQHAVFWADERAICILAEQQIRDAIDSGVPVVVEVESPCNEDARRVRLYLEGVVADATVVIGNPV